MRLRRAGAAVVIVVVLAGLAGCESKSEQILTYGMGVAKIGGAYQLFVPLCAGEQVVEVVAYDRAVDASAAEGDDRDVGQVVLRQREVHERQLILVDVAIPAVGDDPNHFHQPMPVPDPQAPAERIAALAFPTSYSVRSQRAVRASRSSRSHAARGSPSRG